MRSLRTMVGEALVETGRALVWLGALLLPEPERHPAFYSNGKIDEWATELTRRSRH